MSSYTTYAVPLVSLRSPSRICRIAPYFPKMSYISSAVMLNGRFRTYRMRFTSGGRRAFRLLAPAASIAADMAPEPSRA